MSVDKVTMDKMKVDFLERLQSEIWKIQDEIVMSKMPEIEKIELEEFSFDLDVFINRKIREVLGE